MNRNSALGEAYFEENRLLTVSEAADVLSSAPDTVRKWTKEGLLKCYRIGPRRDRRYRMKDLNAFLENSLENPDVKGSKD